ncbi:MAG: helix-turn-helix domain-containing protein [Chloroflexota bacterium]
MSAIARHSGVTQSMIHHYFGSKEALWQAVKNYPTTNTWHTNNSC